MSMVERTAVLTLEYWVFAQLKDFILQCTIFLNGFDCIHLTLDVQVTTFWEKVLDKDAKERLVSNIAGHLKDAKDFIQKRAVSVLLPM